MILIHKQIGNSVDKYGNVTYGINGSDFGAEMLYLQKVCKNITVRINSVGGSVLDGYGIASSIYNSAVPVTTIIDGLAASTALWCAASGNERKVMDYAMGMIHGSTGGEDVAMTELVDKTINTQLANRSGKSSDEIKAMMQKETWLDAKGLKEMGIVDEIISTNKKLKIKKSDSMQNIANIYNTFINPRNMSKLNTLLKISNNADEAEQEAAILALNKELEDKNAELEKANNTIKVLQEEKDAKELEIKTALKNKATALGNNGVKDGKIKADELSNFIEMASASEASFTFASNMIGLASSSKEAKKIFNVASVKDSNNPSDGRESWTIRDWEIKDSKGLAEMKNSNPEIYETLFNSFYKKQS